jgi:hypothetical protein
MAQAITILDFVVDKVYTYEVSEQALRHNDAEELVELFGHDGSHCHYMVHDLGQMEINMVELPF